MHIDEKTVRKIGHLSRIEIKDDEIKSYQDRLSQILTWADQLSDVNTDDVEPQTSVFIDQMPERKDIVNDGGQANAVLSNAPEQELGMFVVPKVIE